MLRLRAAGFGVIVGGFVLGVLGAVVSFQLAAVAVLVTAIGGALLSPLKETWIVQLYLGIGSVGGIGLIEASTSVGFGFEAAEFALIAVFFGLVDIVAGTAIHRFQRN